MRLKAEEIIKLLNLQPHPEGGYYSEVYRSEEIIARKSLPERYNGDRVFSTSIYYLLRSGERSVLHLLASDETWHYYEGSPVKLVVFCENKYIEVTLGTDFESGQKPQHTIQAGCVFGAFPVDKDSFSLVGCTVAPGFAFDDFSYANTDTLLNKFPEQKEMIQRLSGEQNEEPEK